MSRARAATARISGRTTPGSDLPVILSTKPCGMTSRPPEHHRRPRRGLRVALQFLEPLLQPALQGVRPPTAQLARVEARAGLAGPLFKRELRGALVPVRDLLGEAVLHGRLGLVDQREPGRADFREMLRDERRRRRTPAPPAPDLERKLEPGGRARPATATPPRGSVALSVDMCWTEWCGYRNSVVRECGAPIVRATRRSAGGLRVPRQACSQAKVGGSPTRCSP